MARLRLGYTKSRTGCLRCKQRRVKCDEGRPCRACIRHNVECSLVSGQSPTSNSSASTTQTAPSPRPAAPRSQAASSVSNSPTFPPPPPSDPFPYFAKFVSGRPDSQTADWISDMELLHQWSTSTFEAIIDPDATPAILRLWQIEVPKMAFHHTFLLHQILAIAAYHLAYLRPESRQQYSFRASQHQNVAIIAMRDELSNITSENCHALFAASGFLFISVLAASQLDTSIAAASTSPGPTVDDLLDVFVLIKGIGGLLGTSNTDLLTGPLRELFDTVDPADKQNLMLDRVIQQLEMFLCSLREADIGGTEGLDDETTLSIIENSTNCLIASIREGVANSKDAEYRIVTAFPILMPDEFVPLLRQKNQLALVLLSYYCVVMHASELKYWFMKGWSGGVVLDISSMAVPPWNEHSAWSMGWITAENDGVPD